MKHKKPATTGQDDASSMPLSSLLVGKSSKITGLDADLDNIFKSSASAALSYPSEPSRLATSSSTSASFEGHSKRAPKRKGIDTTEPEDSISQKRRKSFDADALAREHSSLRVESKKHGESAVAVSNPDLSEGQDIEEYSVRSHKSARPRDGANQHTRHGESSSEAEDNIVPPQHESLTAKTSEEKDGGPKTKTKYVPPEETKEQRDERTIFVGNLPTEVAKSKPALRGLRRLITSAVPGCKIESIRLRSVAFQNPTSELPKLDDESTFSKSKKSSRQSDPAPNSHDQLTGRQSRLLSRAAQWRKREDAESERFTDAKTFLTPAEKKRIAFIKGEVHSEATTVHAYVVFAYEELGRSKNVPPVMNPFEAAKKAVEVCDGMVYMDRTIRVDHVQTSNVTPNIRRSGHLDPRRTIFVGGLDFQTNEEDLRAFFEKLLLSERDVSGGGDGDGGSRSGSDDESITAADDSWVSHVRLIRDNKTQLGKGIAYVEFKERDALDEIMAVDRTKFKMNKRNIRIERCKNVTSSVISKPSTRDTARERASNRDNTSRPSARNKGQVPGRGVPGIPKGDPTLGDRLRGLDKDERRATKAADSSRQARRLAKKKARHALESAGLRTNKNNSAGAVLGNMKALGKHKVKTKVSRVRSAKSTAKRNMKK